MLVPILIGNGEKLGLLWIPFLSGREPWLFTVSLRDATPYLTSIGQIGDHRKANMGKRAQLTREFRGNGKVSSKNELVEANLNLFKPT